MDYLNTLLKATYLFRFRLPKSRQSKSRQLQSGLIWLFCASLFSFSIHAQETAKVCVDHYPPLQIISSDGSVDGYNIQVLKAVADRLGITLEYRTDIPFTRCLNCMRSGNCDLMIGLLDVDDRREYMEMFQYSGQSDKVFYLNNSSTHKISEYKDLKGLVIGVNRGYRYFEEFDQEKSLFEKVYVDSREQLFRMLLSKRVDAIVCNYEICKSLIERHPEWQSKVKRSAYSFVGENPSYIGLSKKSKLTPIKSNLKSIISDMFLSGQVDMIVERYTRERPEKN